MRLMIVLSPSEQKLYTQVYQTGVFRSDEISKDFDSAQSALHAISNLQKKGYTIKIKRGLYAVVPFETVITGDAYEPNPVLIASKMAQKEFVSHSTALAIHSQKNIPRTLYFCCVNRIPNVSFKGYRFVCVVTDTSFGFETIQLNDKPIVISDKERTILDCLRKIKYCRSAKTLLNFILNETLNYDNLATYLENFNETSLYLRLGCMLSLCKHRIDVPDWFIHLCKSKKSNKVYYLDDRAKGASTNDSDWNVMIPDEVLDLIR